MGARAVGCVMNLAVHLFLRDGMRLHRRIADVLVRDTTADRAADGDGLEAGRAIVDRGVIGINLHLPRSGGLRQSGHEAKSGGDQQSVDFKHDVPRGLNIADSFAEAG